MEKLNKTLVSIFEQSENAPLLHKRIDKFIYFLIILSSLGVVLETLESIKSDPFLLNLIYLFEDIAMAIFVIEMLARLLVFRQLFQNSKTTWGRVLLFVYTIIDFLAILPPILFVLGSEHHDYFLTLRLLRVFKIFSHDDSIELVLRAIIIKKDVLFKTALIILITTVFLAVLLYEAENKFEDVFASIDIMKQEEGTKFTNIWITMTWSFSMFVGDLAGYIESGFIPTTPMGRVIAGILGFLNIAIVVIPTGIIASGFLEVLDEKKVESQHKVLIEAFRRKPNTVLGIDLHERPRTMFTLQNALFIHQNNLFKILESKPGFRLRAVQSDDSEKYSDLNLVEYFGYGELTEYGVKRVEKEAAFSVVCPDAWAHKGIGYFSYAISELQNANLISNERYQENSLDIQYDASFLTNELYFSQHLLPKQKKALKKIPRSEVALYHFKQDILELSKNHPVLVFLSDSEVSRFHIEQIEIEEKQENDFYTWLIQNNINAYIISISQQELNNYSFYELIKEVSLAISNLEEKIN